MIDKNICMSYPRRLINTNVISLQRQLICQIQSVLSGWIELSLYSKYLGYQTGLLNYEWCEAFSRKHADNTMNIKKYTSGKARFVDRMGYDIFIMEKE